MATVITSRKACAVNPLKMSAPLGASYAFMGLASCMPLMHGSQGCTSFGLVLLVRHFKEAIPLQTTAMNEVTTILGGFDNLEAALLNIHARARPAVIAICTTGLTETKGDDMEGYLQLVRQRHPALDDTALVCVSTPDYVGAFQDGWARAVTALVKQIPLVPAAGHAPRQGVVNVLPGSHLTPGDIEELRLLMEEFGLQPVFVPDVSGSLDGHMPDEWLGTTIGGTPLEAVRDMGTAMHTLALGEQMRDAAMALHARCGTPFTVLQGVTGLAACDELVRSLMQLSGRLPSPRVQRQRSQLIDTMLDAHFHTGGVKVAIGAEPDLLWALTWVLHGMGADVQVAVTTTASCLLEQLPVAEVVIGDLEDFEQAAAASGCDLLLTHSHGRQAASRLGKPLLRVGLPLFDRIGNAHRVMAGYRGTCNLIHEIGNLMIEQIAHHHPGDWPLPAATLAAVERAGQPILQGEQP